jgi:hypothetical protein
MNQSKERADVNLNKKTDEHLFIVTKFDIFPRPSPFIRRGYFVPSWREAAKTSLKS